MSKEWQREIDTKKENRPEESSKVSFSYRVQYIYLYVILLKFGVKISGKKGNTLHYRERLAYFSDSR